MSKVKGRCPLRRAGPDFMFLVDQWHGMEVSSGDPGAPAQPSQLGWAGVLGQNNATVSSLDKESGSLTTRRGCGHPGRVVCRARRKHPKKEMGLMQP